MSVVRTPAIVLRRTNYGEADRILQLLTPSGRLSVMARGVRKEKSKLAGGIELFAESDVVINSGKGDLGILTAARLTVFYRHILENYERMQFGYEAVGLVGKASEHVDEAGWYDVLSSVLWGLNEKNVPLALTQTWFYVQYAALLGHELSLYHDINGEKLQPETRYQYDISEQGLRPHRAGEVTTDHVKLLRVIAAKPLKTVAQIGGIEAILGDCFSVARAHAGV